MTVPAQLVGQIFDSHFDATELRRESRADQRDPHWTVRWQRVPVRLRVSGGQAERAATVELRAYPASCQAPTPPRQLDSALSTLAERSQVIAVAIPAPSRGTSQLTPTLSYATCYLQFHLEMNTPAGGGTIAVPKPRLVHLAWLYLQDWLSVTPIFLPTVRFRPALKEPDDPRPWVSPTTEIVIEGYPRSGNTFAVVAFRLAQGRQIEIAHHLHAAAQIKRAARLDVPAVVLIREPSEAILSLVVRDPHASIRWALCSYIRFYSAVIPYLAKTVVAPFATATSDLASIIRMVNASYGTAFKEFVPTEDALNSVRQTVEWMGQRDSIMTGQDYRLGVALPSEQRRRAKDARRTEYLDERNKPLRLTAESLYERVMQYSRN